MLAGIWQPVAVPTEKEPVIAAQHSHTPLTARTPKPRPLAAIMTGRPLQENDLPDVFPGVRPTLAAAILDDEAAVYTYNGRSLSF